MSRWKPLIGATGPPGHHEDYEVVAIDDWPEAGARGGEAGWKLYVTIFDAFERVASSSARHEAQFVDARTDKVLVHHRFDLSGGKGRGFVERNFWDVVTIRDGKILREHWFADRTEALEAAGLRE